MSTERISIFNYEAFYLDYLEGNLGEEDTALLLAFLEEHPELIEEDEDFVLLDPAADTPVFDDKDSLKMVSDDEAIALSNVEHFLIAESEGQLTEPKQEELNAFVAEHPHLEKERKYLAAMFLKADTSIVYGNKTGLKRKGGIVIWPYVAMAAASVLIAFLLFTNNVSDTEVVADKDPVENKEELKNETPVIDQDDIQIANNGEENSVIEQSDNDSVGQSDNRKKKRSNTAAMSVDRQEGSSEANPIIQQSNDPSPQQDQIANVDEIKPKKPRRSINSIDKQKPQPISPQIEMQEIVSVPQNDIAQAEPTMKNPIKPITSRLAKTLNTEVDFKTAKAANNTGGGFELKIGKFELSRKKGKRKKN
jgi:hypothetical protein